MIPQTPFSLVRPLSEAQQYAKLGPCGLVDQVLQDEQTLEEPPSLNVGNKPQAFASVSFECGWHQGFFLEFLGTEVSHVVGLGGGAFEGPKPKNLSLMASSCLTQNPPN